MAACELEIVEAAAYCADDKLFGLLADVFGIDGFLRRCQQVPLELAAQLAQLGLGAEDVHAEAPGAMES